MSWRCGSGFIDSRLLRYFLSFFECSNHAQRTFYDLNTLSFLHSLHLSMFSRNTAASALLRDDPNISEEDRIRFGGSEENPLSRIYFNLLSNYLCEHKDKGSIPLFAWHVFLPILSSIPVNPEKPFLPFTSVGEIFRSFSLAHEVLNFISDSFAQRQYLSSFLDQISESQMRFVFVIFLTSALFVLEKPSNDIMCRFPDSLCHSSTILSPLILTLAFFFPSSGFIFLFVRDIRLCGSFM